jgi:hypothetical protein
MAQGELEMTEEGQYWSMVGRLDDGQGYLEIC